MDLDEHIQTHLLSVWREEKKFLKRGAEGMLFLTEKHLMFVTKTQAKYKWWDPAVLRQIRTLNKSKDTMIQHDGYGDEELRLDLENKSNAEISYDQVSKVDIEEKPWGSVLKLEINFGNKTKKYQFSIVEGWVKYPVKDPVKFMRVDWTPVVDYIKSRQKIME
ncbi:MAG: hypothetical protein ACT4N1_01575 [Nitrososphaerota archaeon]